MAIISCQNPKRVADLLGYQSLIIGASQDCRKGQWVTYDCRFRLKASASHVSQWSVIDVTIWNMTFPKKAIQCHQPQRSAPYNPYIFQTLLNGHSAKINQSIWTGMTAQMVAPRLPATTNTYVIIVSTTLELRTSTTKLPSVHSSRKTGSTITSHNSYSSPLADSFFLPSFYFMYTIVFMCKWHRYKYKVVHCRAFMCFSISTMYISQAGLILVVHCAWQAHNYIE